MIEFCRKKKNLYLIDNTPSEINEKNWSWHNWVTLIFKVGKCFINALHKTETYTWSIFSKQNLEVFKIEN